MPFFAQLLIGFAMSLAGSLITVKLADKGKAKAESEELKTPTASPSKSLPVAFGTVRIKSPNVIAFTDAMKTDVYV